MAVKEKALANAKACHCLPSLRFYEGEFVLNAVSGMFYRLTPAAGYLLRSLDAGVEIGQLAALIQTRYGVDQKIAVRDVELLLGQLTALGLLTCLRDNKQHEKSNKSGGSNGASPRGKSSAGRGSHS